MRFTVVYSQKASDQLADLWLNHFDRSEIAEASRAIDLALRDDAQMRGMPSGDQPGELAFKAGPLTAYYTVSLEDRQVSVWRVVLIQN